MKSTQELSDLMVLAYKHKKDANLSLALKSWAQLIKHKSSDNEMRANAYLNIAQIHSQQGSDDLAFESMLGAIEANPNSAEAYYCLACQAQQNEDFTAAIKYFNKVLKIKKNDVGAINNLANCHDRLNETSKAIELYSKAIEVDDKYVAAIYNRGNAYIKSGDKDLALMDLSLVIRLDDNFYQAYYNRATLLSSMNQQELAKQDFNKAKILAQQELNKKTI